MPEIIVSILDSPAGPVPVFQVSDGGTVPPELAKRVSLRASLSLALMQSDQFTSTDAVLPFSEMNRAGYCYLFQVPGKASGKNLCAISYLMLTDQNFTLYGMIPTLKLLFSNIAKTMVKDYLFQEISKELPKSIQSALTRIVKGEMVESHESTPSSTSQELTRTGIQLITEKLSGSWDFLLKRIDKNLECAIFDLVVGRPVVISCDSQLLAKIAMASLEHFALNKNLKKAFGDITTETLIAETDLIGVPSKTAPKIKGYTVIDLDRNRIINAVNRVHFRDFLKALQGKTEAEAEVKIKEFLGGIFLEATHLAETFGNRDDEGIKTFQKKYSKDELEAIVEITSKHNPLISTLLKESMTKKMSDWLSDFA